MFDPLLIFDAKYSAVFLSGKLHPWMTAYGRDSGKILQN